MHPALRKPVSLRGALAALGLALPMGCSLLLPDQETQRDAGQPCEANHQCVSGHCANGLCSPAGGVGGADTGGMNVTGGDAGGGAGGAAGGGGAGGDAGGGGLGGARCTGWTTHINAPGEQVARTISVDATDEVYVAGEMTGTVIADGITHSAIAQDIFVSRLGSADGEIIWFKRFGDAGDQRASAIQRLGDTLLVAGDFTGTLPLLNGDSLAATTPRGFVLGLATTGGLSSDALSYGSPLSGGVSTIGLDADDPLRLLAINFDEQLESTTQNGFPVLSLTTDDAGVFVWSGDPDQPSTIVKYFIIGDDVEGHGFAAGPSGQAMLAADFTGAVELKKSPFPTTTVTSSGGRDILLTRLESSGMIGANYGGGGDDTVSDLALRQAEIIFTGQAGGSMDLADATLSSAAGDTFIASLSDMQTHAWSWATGGTAHGGRLAMVEDGVWLGLNYSGALDNVGPLTATGQQNILLIKFDTTGQVVATHSYGTSGVASLTDLAAMSDGSLVMAGSLNGTMTIGCDELVSDDVDFFVAQVIPAR